MDALFLPLAELVGASVDQIKVLIFDWEGALIPNPLRTAHFMSFNCIPTREPLCSHTLHTTCTEAFVQHHCRAIFLLASVEVIFWLLSTPC